MERATRREGLRFHHLQQEQIKHDQARVGEHRRNGGERLHLNPHLLGAPDGLKVLHPISHEALARKIHDQTLTRKFHEQKADSFGI